MASSSTKPEACMLITPVQDTGKVRVEVGSTKPMSFDTPVYWSPTEWRGVVTHAKITHDDDFVELVALIPSEVVHADIVTLAVTIRERVGSHA
jgi:hypothetical protein